MAANKISPIYALRMQKRRLQKKSDELTYSLEENFEYLQHNLPALVGQAATDAVVSKLPPFVQNLLGRKTDEDDYYDEDDEDRSTYGVSRFGGIADQALDVIPFFFKGFKGIALAFLLKKLKNRFLK